LATEPKPSVDDLRARLRDLGYLDAGIDRFVLAPVKSSRGIVSVAWRSSVRIGLLAALLLGPSAAMALAVRLPNLVTGLRDAGILALYLALLFGTGTTATAFAATLALGLLAARSGNGAAIQARATRLANASGAGVAIACLVYLVLWWRTVSGTGAVSSGAAWALPVLLGVVAISMLLGHAVRVATLALAAREVDGIAPGLRLRSRSWLLTLALGALAVAAGAGLLFLAPLSGAPAAAPDASAIRSTPTGIRLTVIAVDGLDVPFLERLRSAGRVPTFSQLLGGARLVLPPSDAPDPARTWTSLATGQSADIHGITGIEARRVSGTEGTVSRSDSGLAAIIGAATDFVWLTRPALTTGLQRHAKTFWEVAAECGLRVAVVNWWATWPAPDGAGVVLSDRATLRLERGGELDAELAPATLYPSLLAGWPALRDAARARVVAAFPDVNDPDAAALRRAGEQDAVQIMLAARVFDPAADLQTIYLPGLDIAQHALVGSGGGTGLPASVMAARVDALERYYIFLDGLIAPLVQHSAGGSVVALVSDSGRSPSPGPGVVALSGSPILAGNVADGAAADLVPTLLCMLGIPTSRELPGRPRVELLGGELRARAPVRMVESYGRRIHAPRPPGATPLDREALDRLRSLGYVR
jgi:hypothetical protein